MSVVDLTKQTAERGYFSHNQEMLEKTKPFLDAILAKYPTGVHIQRVGDFIYNVHIMNQVWQFENDGNVAQMFRIG